MSGDRFHEFSNLVLPSEALGDKMNAFAEVESRQGEDSIERLALRVGPLGLLFPVRMGSEVLAPPNTSRLAYLPAWVLGLANVRGTLVPVVDLAEAIGLSRDVSARQYTLMVGNRNESMGLLVDGLPVTCKFERKEMLSALPPHPDMLAGHITGALDRNGEVWLDVNAKRLLSALGAQIPT